MPAARPQPNAYPFPYTKEELDFRPLLQSHHSRSPSPAPPSQEIARAFQRGLGEGLCNALSAICKSRTLDTVVLSGGVFQNELLLEDLKELLTGKLQVWTNQAVPPNDGGISLGQAAIAAFASARNDAQRVQLEKGNVHELSIAVSIVELAEEESARRGGARITAVHLKLGALSGVVKEALLLSYEMACEGTTLQGSHLIVEDAPVVVFCPKCQTQRPLQSVQSFCCPECSTPTSQIVQGNELELVALEIEEWVENPA